MEIKRTANWAESISSILRKTELNLLRIQRTSYLHDEFARPTSTMTHLDLSMDQRQRPPMFEPEDNISIIQQELSGVKLAIERLISEKYKQHQNEMYNLGSRLADVEDKQVAFEDLRDEMQNALLSFGRRSLGDIRKSDDSYKGYATKEDLKLLEETFKNSRQHQINQMEIQIRDLRQENSGMKEFVYQVIDDKMKESAKKAISQYELRSIKEEIVGETTLKIKELEKKLNASIEEAERQHQQQQEDHNRSMKELTNSTMQKMEMYSKLIDETKQSIGNTQHNVNSEISHLKNDLKQFEREFDTIDELKQNIGNVHTYASEELGKVKKELKQLENAFDTQDIESDIESLKRRIEHMPNQTSSQDFSIFVTREEFNQLGNVRRDLKQLENLFSSQDIWKEIDYLKKQTSQAPQDISSFITKSDFAKELAVLNQKFQEQTDTSKKLLNKLEGVENRLTQIEEEDSDEYSLELSKKEESREKLMAEPVREIKPEENKEYSGLATFGKAEEKEPSELVAISFNNLGESDDDSQGFVSPMISPMNQVIGPISSSKQKKFQFADPQVIQEELHEEEGSSPQPKAAEPRKDLEEYIIAFTNELIKTELEDGLIVVKEVFDRHPKPKLGQKHGNLLPNRK